MKHYDSPSARIVSITPLRVVANSNWNEGDMLYNEENKNELYDGIL